MKCFLLSAVVAVAVLAGCGKPTAEEYFALAQDAEARAVKAADSLTSHEAVMSAFQPVIDAFQKVIAGYPDHELAEAALFRIANIRNNNTHEPSLAIDAYRLLCARYPDGKKTSVAMFMIGYLYNNELHNTDSAGAAYRRFLAKYPNDEMALSAQFELNTLGKPPEDVLPKAAAPPSPAGSRKGGPKKGSRRPSV